MKERWSKERALSLKILWLTILMMSSKRLVKVRKFLDVAWSHMYNYLLLIREKIGHMILHAENNNVPYC